jgi:hypothetical protein
MKLLDNDLRSINDQSPNRCGQNVQSGEIAQFAHGGYRTDAIAIEQPSGGENSQIKSITLRLSMLLTQYSSSK